MTFFTKTLSLSSLVLGAFAGGAFAQTAPAPAAIVNAAGNIPGSLPGGSIAQGAIFVLYGKNLGGATLAQATALPFPKTGLNGTTASITVGSTTLAVPLYYTLSTQLAGILPSTTPVGNATINITYNGATGSLAFKVVKSSFGISTVDTSGSGPAVVTFGDISLVTPTKPAKAGDVLVIWGTGLGPTSGDDAIAPVQGDLNSGARVWVQGVEATVVYAGRSASPGLDQINFKAPANVGGCHTSLVVQIGALTSNFTNIAIADAGQACNDYGKLKDDYSALLPALLAKDSVKLGLVHLEQSSKNDGTVGFSFPTKSSESVFFLNMTKAQFAPFLKQVTPQNSVGSCSVTFLPGATSTDPTIPTDLGIDAGSVFTLTPPAGAAIAMTAQKPGIYSASATSSVSTIPPGAWKMSNGTGGTAVAAFTSTMALPQAVAWFNAGNSSSIDRTKGLVVDWGGGDQNANYVEITGNVPYGVAPNAGIVYVNCMAVHQPRTFTIPAQVFQALPATPTGLPGLAIGLAVNTSNPPQVLPVAGTDLTLATSTQYLKFDGSVK